MLVVGEPLLSNQIEVVGVSEFVTVEVIALR